MDIYNDNQRVITINYDAVIIFKYTYTAYIESRQNYSLK